MDYNQFEFKNKPTIDEILSYQNLFICGAIGSGKSVLLHQIVNDIMAKGDSNKFSLYILDPKRCEFYKMKEYKSIEICIKSIMAVDIITKEDLKEFKIELLEDLQKMLFQKTQDKKWLKSNEVRKLLKISSGTLQTLRINGTLQYSKVGGTIYYNYQDIEKMLNQK